MEQRYKAVMFDLDGTLLDIFRLEYYISNHARLVRLDRHWPGLSLS